VAEKVGGGGDSRKRLSRNVVPKNAKSRENDSKFDIKGRWGGEISPVRRKDKRDTAMEY